MRMIPLRINQTESVTQIPNNQFSSKKSLERWEILESFHHTERFHAVFFFFFFLQFLSSQMIIPSSKALMVLSCEIMLTVCFPHESTLTFQLALALLSSFILRKVYPNWPNWKHGVILSQSLENEWTNPLGKRLNIHFSSSPDTPFIRQELFAASHSVCVWAPPPPSWTNLPKDPPSKTAVLHKKAQTDTLIILKPCGTGCVDLKSSSPLYHRITVNYSLAICCCCCFLPQTKSLWWFTKHFSAQVSDKSLAEGDQKDSVAFQSRCVPFLSTNDDFHAPTIVGREWREGRVFIPWNSPRFLLLPELELMAEEYSSLTPHNPNDKNETMWLLEHY